MGKNKKKTGKGAEKTAAKTDKKLSQKLKKQLAATGEDDVEKILAEIEREESERCKVVEKVIGTPPTKRAFCSLSAHPYRDELIVFGGEYHNGHETWVYNDLFIYKINSNEWILLKIPGAPPPRTSHQAVIVPSNKGELWVFGGEFTTKSESQFHHYRDLWMLQLDTKQWTHINAPGGPSSRSGHRMVQCKRQLIVFGGYHDALQECKYYNDVYAFNLDDRTWKKLEPSGNPPLPRSGCQMVVTTEGKILIWGGYSKTKTKKDVEAGMCHNDMFLLSPEKGDATGTKWKWSIVKPGGLKLDPRSGVSVTVAGNKAFTFGGASDHETEEDLNSEFHNELLMLETQKLIWSEVTISGKKEVTKQRRKKTCDGDDNVDVSGTDADVEMEVCPEIEEKVSEDGIFTLKVGGSLPQTSNSKSQINAGKSPSHPHPRINTALAVKNSKLYLYGGIFEEDIVQYTLSDLHVLDLHKLDEWKTIIPCSLDKDWINSSSSSCTSDESDCSDMEDLSDECR